VNKREEPRIFWFEKESKKVLF